MSTVQRIAKNTAVLLVAQVASYLLSFFYMMYTARYLGPANFGVLSFAIAFTGIFAVFGDLGLQPLTVREIARDKSLAGKYLANLSLMKVILAAITFGLIASVINLMGYSRETVQVVYLLALSVVLGAFTQMFYSIFQAFERMEFQAVGQMINAALVLVGVIIAVNEGLGIYEFAALYVTVSGIVLGYSFSLTRLKFSNRPSVSMSRWMRLDWSFWKATLREALPFGVTNMFVSFYYYVDTVMLSVLQGDVAVGWYNAAYKIALTLLFIPGALNTALFPIMSGLYKSSREFFGLSFERYFKYMVILGIPIGIGTTLLASRFVFVVFGADYAESTRAVQILVWSIVVTFVATPFATLFSTANKQSIVTKVTVFGTLLNIVLNAVLIPKYSFIGASIATVVSTSIYLVPYYAFSVKIGHKIDGRKIISTLVKVIISSGLMAVFVVHLNALSLTILVPSAAAVYIALILALRGIDRQDKDFAKSLFR